MSIAPPAKKKQTQKATVIDITGSDEDDENNTDTDNEVATEDSEVELGQ